MKRKLLTTLAFFIIIINCYSQIPQDSLLLYYPFNGNAIDESGNNLNGTVHGATLTNDRFGNLNSAYFFDGINDYIEMPNEQVLKPSLPLSISFWAKIKSLYQLDNVFFSTSPDVNNHAGCEINTTSDNLGRVNINIGDNLAGNTPESRRTKTADVNLSTGIWYHIVGVFKDTTDMDIYINGSKINGNYSGSGKNIDYNSNPGCIGRLHSALYFWGALDDFSYYNKALTQNEVTELFTQRNCNGIVYDTITVTDTLLIYDSIAVTDTLLINVADLFNNNNIIKIYPNPTKDIIFINIGNYNSLDNYSIRIINGVGKTIFNNLCDKQEFKISLTTFGSSGLYYVQIYDPQYNILVTKKIILY